VIPIKKLVPILILAVLLIAPFAMADVELGISQGLSSNALRMDAAHFVFEVPLDSSVSSFSAGATIPTTFWDMYGVALLDFKEDEGKFGFGKLNLGLGYPLKFGQYTLKGELRASNPKWSEFKETKVEAIVSLQFGFSALKPQQEG